MRCIYCGEELKEGCLYCPKCGKAVQIVPDYNIYDEDYLNQVLAEENRKSPEASVFPDHSTSPKQPGKKGVSVPAGKQKKAQWKIMLMVAGIVCVLIFSLLILGAAIRSNHNNSFDYQVQQAQKAEQAGDTQKAIACYEHALTLDKSSVDVRLALAKLYVGEKEYDSALVLYQEILREDKKNREACKGIIEIYKAKGDTDAILSLSVSVDASLSDLFADYQVEGPRLSLKSGIFESAQILQILSTKRYDIYYTMDGSDPKENGTLYTDPIRLNENNKTYQVKAVCKNPDGIYSEVVEQTYTIRIPAPNDPIVTPDGGNFTEQTTVTISVPQGCSAYYTWDGSTPDASSSRYTHPLYIPEGNNILSVVVIDNRTRLHSDIYKGNFVYYTPDDENEDVPEADEEKAESNSLEE